MQNSQVRIPSLHSTDQLRLTENSHRLGDTKVNNSLNIPSFRHGLTSNHCAESSNTSSTKYLLQYDHSQSGSSTDTRYMLESDHSQPRSSTDTSSTRFMLPTKVVHHIPNFFQLPNRLNNADNTHNTHQMITRRKAGIVKPKIYCASSVSQSSTSSTVQEALADPIWFKAMAEEFFALQ